MVLYDLNLRERYARLDKGSYGGKNFGQSLAILYQENSKMDRMLLRRHGEQIQQFDSDYFRQRSSQPYKVYAGAKLTALADYQYMGAPQADYFDLLKARQSVRQFEAYPISLRELYVLCHYTYGISRRLLSDDGQTEMGFRYVPSGGGLYPLELYVLVLSGLPVPGLYHYRPDIEALEQLQQGDFRETAREIISAEPYISLEHASCIFFFTSVMERTLIKYGDRGYRWILMEVGFASQNLALASGALGLGGCLAGGFLDEEVNRFLEIDGVSETVQKVMVVGKPAAPADVEAQ